MISKFLVLLTATVGLNAQANVMIYADQVPTIVLAGDGNKADTAKVLNIINNSLVYSMVTTKYRNGTGNKFLERPAEDKNTDKLPLPKLTQNMSEYFLRQLSLYDLYFQRSLQESKIQNFKVGVHLFPTTGPLTNSLPGLGQSLIDQTLKDIMGSFAPAASAIVKVAKPQQLFESKNLQAIRDAQLDAAKKRYPVDDSFNNGKDWAAKSAWLIFSHLPLSISSTFEVANTAGMAKTSIIFPALGIANVQKPAGQSYQTIDDVKLSPLWLTAKGVPGSTKIDPIVSDVAVIDDIRFFPDDRNRYPRSNTREQEDFERRKKSRALKVEFIKDFSSKHLMEMDISFGYLPEKATTSFTDLNVDLLRDPKAAIAEYENDVYFNAGTVMDPQFDTGDIEAYAKAADARQVVKKVWRDLTRNIDFALVAKGDVKLKINSEATIKSWADAANSWKAQAAKETDSAKKQAALKKYSEYTAKKEDLMSANKWNERMNEVLSLLEIRIVFHKMHLVMDRLPTRKDDAEYAVLNPKANDLNFFLTEDIGFKLKNMTLDKDKSVISLRLTVKPDKIKEFGGFLNKFTSPVKNASIDFFCAMTRNIEKDNGLPSTLASLLFAPEKWTGNWQIEPGPGVRYSPCEANFASYKDFKQSFLPRLVNMFAADSASTAIKDSVDAQTSDVQEKLDKVIGEVAFKVLNAIQASRMRFDSVLGKVVSN